MEAMYRIDPSLQGTNRLKRPRETEEVLIGSRAQFPVGRGLSILDHTAN